MEKKKLITVIGTTACGKSDIGIELATRFGGEIISADSRQVYRHLDLGTGKVTPKEMELVPHHLIDILELNQPFSMAEFQSLAYEAIEEIHSRKKLPFLVGGTGLYTRCVVEGYQLSDVAPNEKLRAELNQKSVEELRAELAAYGDVDLPAEYSARRLVRMLEKRMGGVTEEVENRPRYDVLQLAITYPREELYERIAIRLDRRIAAGMVEEVEGVLKLGATPEFLEGLGLEYRLTYRYLTGQYPSFQDYRNDLYLQICHFAKRQMTWFRKEKNVLWLNPYENPVETAQQAIEEFLA